MERFWVKVDKRGSDECWPWLAGKSLGYGSFRYGGKACTAHSIVWQLIEGSPPQGTIISHICGDKLCMNPRHLEAIRPGPDPILPSLRFWSKVQKGSGCWEWTGSTTLKGYGQLHLGGGGSHVAAHRFSWTLAHGPIPSGMIIMHICDNPPCVRPDHLKLGTIAENQADMARKGRAGQRGERSPVAKLNDDAVRDIRRAAACGTPVAELARRYGVARSLIRGVRNGTRWSHVKCK